jgi:hypothetical protein
MGAAVIMSNPFVNRVIHMVQQSEEHVAVRASSTENMDWLVVSVVTRVHSSTSAPVEKSCHRFPTKMSAISLSPLAMSIRGLSLVLSVGPFFSVFPRGWTFDR